MGQKYAQISRKNKKQITTIKSIILTKARKKRKTQKFVAKDPAKVAKHQMLRPMQRITFRLYRSPRYPNSGANIM